MSIEAILVIPLSPVNKVDFTTLSVYAMPLAFKVSATAFGGTNISLIVLMGLFAGEHTSVITSNASETSESFDLY